MRGFGSDNHSGVHPRILAAIARVNDGHAPSYGTDSASAEFAKLIETLFGSKAEAHFVFNGTAANVVGLASVLKPHHAILASTDAHLATDECGAPEKNIGCKVITVATGADGKLSVESLKPLLTRRGDQHRVQPRVLSLTQTTEVGGVYRVAELRALSAWAKAEGLLVHMDGARLVNAAAALGVGLKEITTGVGVDVLSLGGTKNGLLFGEAVVFLSDEARRLASDFKYVRKQLMQLPSKTRFVAAQFQEFLGTDLWLENARHANGMAKRLYEGLKGLPGVALRMEPQANAVFATFPRAWVAPLKEVAFFYVWDEHSFECRLMTTWDTTSDDIDRFVAAVRARAQA